MQMENTMKNIKEILKEMLGGLERHTINEIIKELTTLLDIKKLISYGQILVEFSDAHIIVTGIENDTVTHVIPIEDSYTSDNTSDIKALCTALNLVKYYTGLDNSKHEKHRCECRMTSPSDITVDEIDNIIGKEMRGKLQKAGYHIIKGA